MKKDLILIGGGGHCESIIDSIYELEQYNIIGILDNCKRLNTHVSGVPIIGTDADLKDYFDKGIKHAVIALGSIGNIAPRQRIFNLCKKAGYQFPNIIDRSCVLPQRYQIGEGNFIGKGVIVNTGAAIGNACIVNTGAILEHGCILEDFVHIAPGSLLCGNVQIKANTHIGAHSTIIQNITVGNDSLIGAGSLVLHPIAPHQTAYGSPAKEVGFHA